MNLADHFLIAMPSMDDPFFEGSVVYLCEHNDEGALGVIINKPSPVTMDLVFSASESEMPERFQSPLGTQQRCCMWGITRRMAFR